VEKFDSRWPGLYVNAALAPPQEITLCAPSAAFGNFFDTSLDWISCATRSIFLATTGGTSQHKQFKSKPAK
jgi:hypothetical protein